MYIIVLFIMIILDCIPLYCIFTLHTLVHHSWHCICISNVFDDDVLYFIAYHCVVLYFIVLCIHTTHWKKYNWSAPHSTANNDNVIIIVYNYSTPHCNEVSICSTVLQCTANNDNVIKIICSYSSSHCNEVSICCTALQCTANNDNVIIIIYNYSSSHCNVVGIWFTA